VLGNAEQSHNAGNQANGDEQKCKLHKKRNDLSCDNMPVKYEKRENDEANDGTNPTKRRCSV
jgi:hypothetical protein